MASQDMKKKLEDECKKPGLKNWVGINTDIRVMKLNATWLNMDVSSKSFWHEFAMVRGCCWFCCWRFVPPSPNKVYRPWRDAISKAAVGLSGGLLEDATANHFFMAMQFRGRLIVLKNLNASDFHRNLSSILPAPCVGRSAWSTPANRGSGIQSDWRPKRWCLLHRQEVHLLWRVYPETAFGFNQTLCCCCCWFASWQAWSSQCVSRRERRLVEVGNSSAKLLRAFICPSCTILTETCWRFFPSHIHAMPTAVANCCWWQGFSGASAESAQMHSWCFGPVSTITCCVGTAAVILEQRERCQPNHSVHTLFILFIFKFNQKDRNNLISISQTHKIQIIFNFTFKGLSRAHDSFKNQDIIYTDCLGFRVEDGCFRLQGRPYVAFPKPWMYFVL